MEPPITGIQLLAQETIVILDELIITQDVPFVVDTRADRHRRVDDHHLCTASVAVPARPHSLTAEHRKYTPLN